jgi:hypothetical protein
MATGDRNYDIAKETTLQSILSKVGSRSTKIHNGSCATENNVENTVFEFTGSGKVNKIKFDNNVNPGSSPYYAIRIDDFELYRTSTPTSSGAYYLFRVANGELAFEKSYTSETQPLDIEFKNKFQIIAYPTNNAPTISYEVEISEN